MASPRNGILMLNLANGLTILRILMAPIISILLVYRFWKLALAIFLLAGITDALDGFFARSRAERTELGMILDPLADKLLLFGAFVTLVYLHQIPRWLFIIVVSRDLILIGGFLVLYIATGKSTVSVSQMGKLTTGLQLATVLGTMLAHVTGGVAPYLAPLIYITAAVTIFSGLEYVLRGARSFSG
ncbi:MAG: CDP-diacylglycerol--glycerol-3-phosphate 3-phosphatidyltransferase [Candidatus Methylomirabilis oxyfera]|nr:CDP-diacylglycerol--glycerol-3-phosphate 3-phosphatidyltransferase [Candidatus Methylomirabilis oxyfera]